jgi:hypothetical protein
MLTVLVHVGVGVLVIGTIKRVLDYLIWRRMVSRTRDEHLPEIARHFGRRH